VLVARRGAAPAPARPAGEGIDPEELPAATASEVEVLRHRDLARLSPAERDVVRRLIALLDPVGETRVSRRHRPAYRGTVDPGRTVRTMLRRGGEPVRLERRARRVRPRRLVLLVDVSGSMQPYADPYLRFAHAAARRRPGTEVFTIGTRLTRVTRAMRLRDADRAIIAAGEERLGGILDSLADRGVRVLHDRRIPRSRANIDHIAVGAAGVFVIDAKRYKGRPSLRVEGGILRPRTETLMVGGRRSNNLIDGMHKQLAVVQGVIGREVPITGMVVFLGADWPLIGGAFVTQQVKVLWPKKAAETITQPGTLDAAQIDALHRALADVLKPA
jgi:hypothetical protein